MRELRRCPFCGGEAEIKNDLGQDSIYVSCKYCHCNSSLFENKEKAIEAWNRREPIDKIVEQLEDLNEEEERFVNNHVFIQGIIEIVKGSAV